MNPAHGKKRVLIADGDLLEVSRLQHLLAEHGYSVVAAVTSGEEAVTGAQWLRPDVVLVGLNLEGELDGLMVAEEVGMTTQSRVVYLGESEDTEAFMRENRIEGFDYQGKPAENETILNVADRLAAGIEGIAESCEWEAEFAAA